MQHAQIRSKPVLEPDERNSKQFCLTLFTKSNNYVFQLENIMIQEQGRIVISQQLYIRGVATTTKTLRSHQSLKHNNHSDSTGTHTYTFICIECKVDVWDPIKRNTTKKQMNAIKQDVVLWHEYIYFLLDF